MTTKIALVGAGPLGLNVAGVVKRLPNFELIGFIDNKEGPVGDIDVLGGDSILGRLLQDGVDHLVVCIGNPERRIERATELRNAGFKLPAVVHPSANLGVGVMIGCGSIVLPGAIVLPDARVGDFAVVEAGAFVGHDTILGAGALLGARSLVGNRAVIEDRVIIGMGASVRSGSKVPAGARLADLQIWE